jgi:reactive intermediate/imine deaminase
MTTKKTLLLAAVMFATASAQTRAIVPASGPAPVGPYSPGVMAGDYLYVSGQGAKAPDGNMPDTFEAQVRQTLENVKGVLAAAGLRMENVVYTHVYLEDIRNFDAMNRVYRDYFRSAPPARAVVGVAKLPGTPVEINAVAVRDASSKKPVDVPGLFGNEPVSAGMLTADRLYVSGMLPRRAGDAQAEATDAVANVKTVLEAANLSLANMVFVNPYLTSAMPMRVMNEVYARHFEFGNTPGRATIQVSALPGGANIEFTGVAARDLNQRRAVRPKNMAPSPTASPCVFAGNTLYCSAKSGFIPGVNGGIYAGTVETQLRQTMRNLLDGLEEAGMDFRNVVATNVYLDDLNDFAAMNGLYAKYFSSVMPARTTIQQLAPGPRQPTAAGIYPTLEQISLIAVRLN